MGAHPSTIENRQPDATARAGAIEKQTKSDTADLEIAVEDLRHRLKNLMAVVQAIARQTFHTTNAPQTVQDRFFARMAAFARTDDFYGRSGATIPLARLVEIELAPYGEPNERYQVAGANVMIPAKTAFSLSAVLHELATNAAKYGALSVPEGRVDVRWRCALVNGEYRVQLLWCEAKGPRVKLSDRTGTGTPLLQRIVGRALGGSVVTRLDPDGLRCGIDVPLVALQTSDTMASQHS